MVSNHGGRQLDQAPGSLDVLPAIKAAVGDKLTLLLDSGVRRGADILIALCLGADFCFMGRPTLYGAAAGGLARASRRRSTSSSTRSTWSWARSAARASTSSAPISCGATTGRATVTLGRSKSDHHDRHPREAGVRAVAALPLWIPRCGNDARVQGIHDMNFDQAVNIEDLHRIAKRKLPKIIFDYIEGGVEDERGLARNEAAFHKHRLLPRYLVDVSKRDQSADRVRPDLFEPVRHLADRRRRPLPAGRRGDAGRSRGGGEHPVHHVGRQQRLDGRGAARSRRTMSGSSSMRPRTPTSPMR